MQETWLSYIKFHVFCATMEVANLAFFILKKNDHIELDFSIIEFLYFFFFNGTWFLYRDFWKILKINKVELDFCKIEFYAKCLATHWRGWPTREPITNPFGITVPFTCNLSAWFSRHTVARGTILSKTSTILRPTLLQYIPQNIRK